MPLAIKTTRRDELVENSIFDRVLPRILPGYSRGKGGSFKITPRPVKPGIGPMDFSISDYAEPVAVVGSAGDQIFMSAGRPGGPRG